MTHRKGSRIVPVSLGLAMLAVVLAAGLFPNAGTVQAQSSCPYGGCTTTSSVPAWEYASILALVAAGVIVALVVIMRRRRPPPPAAVPPPVPAGPAGAVGAPPAAPVPPYVEMPEDVGHAPPAVMPPPAPGPAAPPAAPPPAGAESDIDSLMAELDKISNEILKKAPKKGAAAKEPEPTEDTDKPA